METNVNLEDSKNLKIGIFSNLRVWNGFMGALHLIQGIIMWTLSKDLVRDIIWTLPKPIIPEGPIDRTKRAMVVFEAETWFSINLGQTIAWFLFLSAIFHFIIILPQVYPWYLKNIKNEINYLRWFEYALSSSLMLFVIAMLCNINNAATLIPLLAINACMNLFGLSMEMHNSNLKQNAIPLTKTTITVDTLSSKIVEQKSEALSSYKPNWLNFIFGSFAGIIPWLVMGTYFFTSISRLSNIESLPQQVKDILSLVKFIFPALFIFFNLFAINMYLQYKKIGPWKSYLFGEKSYIILSLLAKSFLAWFIWGGTLR
jgi:Heliorhodopsin